MDPIILLLLLVSPLALVAQPTSNITVTGSVFCDVCHDNSFTKHSYFLPGVDVHIQCKFQASTSKTSEQISFSVKRRTNRYGVYRLDIPWVEGVDCVEAPAIESFCEASLIWSPLSSCNVPAVSTSSKKITIKSKSTNACVYSVSALTYRPSYRNATLCGNNINNQFASFNSSKFFLPYFPWPWPSLPPLPQLPPFPSFPPWKPFPSFQIPPLPPLPQLPPLPPLPQLPPLPPLPKLPPLPPLPPLPSGSPQPSSPPLNPGSQMPNTASTSPPPPTNYWIPRYPFPISPTTWLPPSPQRP